MSALRSYEDFEPFSEWVHAEGFVTLVIRLPGFKKNQIKVQITNTDRIKISGERPLDDRRWSRFVKQFNLPEHCKAAETRAKFENGELHVRFPIDQVAPSTTMHILPSSPMEKAATELREKTQEEDGKSRKAVPEGEFLQKEQKQAEAKEEVGHKEHPKANGEQEKKQEQKQAEAKEEVGHKEHPKANGDQEKKQEQKQAEAKEEVGHKEHPEANGDQEKKQEQKQAEAKEEVGHKEHPKANGHQEKKQEQKQAEAKEEVGHKEHPKANGDQEKKQEKLQDKEKTEEGRSNGEKKQGQQMSPTLKTDDTFRQKKETEQPESKGGEKMAKYSINNLLMALIPDKKILLVNVAVFILVFLGIGLYLMYKREDK